jgi:carboxylesterase
VDQWARDAASGVVVGAEASTYEPDGPSDHAVLLLHGFLSCATDFGDLADQLRASGLRVRVVRLPGHGSTPDDLAKVRTEQYARVVREEWSALAQDHERISVVGFSLGAAYMGELYSPPWSPGDTHALAELMQPLTPRVMRPDAFTRLNRREGLEGHFVYRTVPLAAVNRIRPVGRKAAETAAAVSCPTLVLLSETDRVTPSEFGAAFFDGLTGLDGSRKRRVVYARSDHILLRDHDGPAARAAIVGWIAGRDEGARTE